MAKEHDDDIWRQLATHAHTYHSSEDPHFREHYAGLIAKHFAGGGKVDEFEGEDHPHWIPTRLPKIEKNREKGQKVDMESFRNAPGGFFNKNMSLVRDYINVPKQIADSADDHQLSEAFIEHMKDNLLDLHDRVPDYIRPRSQKWYDGARNITDQLSKQYNLPDYSVAGVIAALSPQMDWYKNVSLGKRVIDIMHNHHDTPADDAMRKKFSELDALGKYQPVADMLHGKSLTDIDKMGLPEKERVAAKALWVRLHDETYGDRKHYVLSPEGEEMEPVTSAKGEEAGTGWGSFNEIGKAIKAIESKDDPDAISPLMGMKHKVRNFYNNIISPNSKHGDITADTHAVAAALYRPLSGKSTEVAHNLGTNPPKGIKAAADSATAGISGIYPLVAEAYRRAAKERGILPRQMQSITWEAIRGMFPRTFKNAKNNAAIDSIWRDYRNGLIDQEQARGKVREIALGKDGEIPHPSWFGRGVQSGAGVSDAPPAYPSDKGILHRSGSLGERPEGTGFGAGSGPSEAPPEEITRARGGYIPLHPAMKIPGVHIRTAEAGEPFFHGDK